MQVEAPPQAACPEPTLRGGVFAPLPANAKRFGRGPGVQFPRGCHISEDIPLCRFEGLEVSIAHGINQDMRDGKILVTTVTAIFKTFIPQEKSINQVEKTLWNKGLNFTV